MTVRVRILRRAQLDLLEVDEYQARESRRSGRLVDKLLSAIDSLAQHPLRGPLARDPALRRRGFRFLVVGQHLVFYKAARSSVRVYRILHGRREYRTLL